MRQSRDAPRRRRSSRGCRCARSSAYLCSRYEGERGDDGRTLLLGSHLDSVRDAGRYDGPLGVLVGLACAHRLHRAGERMPVALELVGFSDEEGLRFGTTYLASSAFAGRFDPELLELRDDEGITLADAVRAFGGNPVALASSGRSPRDLIGYCEVHIEQGPVLERRGLPVGVVSAIVGQSRIAVELRGEAGHAGTVPMEARRDALCAAAELVLAVERIAKAHAGMVGTVGRLTPHPGAGNVIPASVALSIEVRHQDDAVRRRACDELRSAAEEIGARRGVEVGWTMTQESAAVPTDPRLTELLAGAVAAAAGIETLRLPSGAGHDAAEIGRSRRSRCCSSGAPAASATTRPSRSRRPTWRSRSTCSSGSFARWRRRSSRPCGRWSPPTTSRARSPPPRWPRRSPLGYGAPVWRRMNCRSPTGATARSTRCWYRSEDRCRPRACPTRSAAPCARDGRCSQMAKRPCR